MGSVLTVAYSIRFVWDAFAGKGRTEPSPAVQRLHAPGPLELSVPALLALGGLVAGVAATWVDTLVQPYADTLPGSQSYHLALWHGVGLPLGLTVLVLVSGALLYLGLDAITRLRPQHALLGNADRAYDAALAGMDRLSGALTSFIQRGSLPLTQATILTTLAVVPSIVLARRDPHGRRATAVGLADRSWRSVRSSSPPRSR